MINSFCCVAKYNTRRTINSLGCHHAIRHVGKAKFQVRQFRQLTLLHMQYIGHVGPDFALVQVKRSKFLLRDFNWMGALTVFFTEMPTGIKQLAKFGEYPAIFADTPFDKIVEIDAFVIH